MLTGGGPLPPPTARSLATVSHLRSCIFVLICSGVLCFLPGLAFTVPSSKPFSFLHILARLSGVLGFLGFLSARLGGLAPPDGLAEASTRLNIVAAAATRRRIVKRMVCEREM